MLPAMLGKVCPLLQKRRKARPGPFGGFAERTAELLVANPLDASAEGLVELERHVFRVEIERIVWAGIEKDLRERCIGSPGPGHVLRERRDIVRDRGSEPATERAGIAWLRQGLGAIAVKKIFECRQTLQRHALLPECLRARDRFVFGRNSALDLAQTEPFPVGPEEQALIAMFAIDRPELVDLDGAPSLHRRGERVPGVLQRPLGGRGA
ncbi:MAG: hypothetical protein A49_11480 [Methyloceanibacter sp.]|nr:MAG: hypothetical protein A49_11480 [Methyloceanibacter sp.]